MDAFQTRENLVLNYRDYLSSFLSIDDKRINEKVAKSFEGNGFIPEPLIQFNPSFQKGDSLNNFLEKEKFMKGLLGDMEILHNTIDI